MAGVCVSGSLVGGFIAALVDSSLRHSFGLALVQATVFGLLLWVLMLPAMPACLVVARLCATSANWQGRAPIIAAAPLLAALPLLALWGYDNAYCIALVVGLTLASGLVFRLPRPDQRPSPWKQTPFALRILFWCVVAIGIVTVSSVVMLSSLAGGFV
jgi:hypothetical protein